LERISHSRTASYSALFLSYLFTLMNLIVLNTSAALFISIYFKFNLYMKMRIVPLVIIGKLEFFQVRYVQNNEQY